MKKLQKVVPPKTETEKPGGEPQAHNNRTRYAQLNEKYFGPPRTVREERIGLLGDARLRAQGISDTVSIDAIDWMIHRASALCDIVGEAAYSASGSELPGESLAVTMDIIREDIQVAKWLAEGMHLTIMDCMKSHTDDAA